IKQKIGEKYREYMVLKKKWESFQTEEEQRRREADFLRFQIDEIENASLKSGEEEECEAAFRRFANARKIADSLSEAYRAVSTEEISRALRSVDQAAQYDDGLAGIRDELTDVDGLLNDLSREIASYLEEMTFDEEQFSRVEARLNLIRNLESKYGKAIEDVNRSLEEKRGRLEELETYDVLRAKTEKELLKTEEKLKNLCQELTEVRKQVAGELTEKIAAGLRDLNFLDVTFTMEFRPLPHYTAGGLDEAEFLISTNPGEPVRPLGQVASGGELSRIMLAIKTVLAETDDIPTLIFDEIDTGISGRTAQMVSEKLHVIAKRHQVICITHLPQIAAMADSHFEIKKSVEEGRTVTRIRELSEGEMTEELARLLGGAEITDAVRRNAREMKELAKKKGAAEWN
ncbi:MAG: DNA repair protein RecN, partial [Clostridium sp.]|nr:DNA repair protein RecN [Clostridium sp.]